MTGTLAIVGLGPGGPEHRTAAAERAVRDAEVVAGYAPYVDACADLLHEGQSILRGRIGEEAERAAEAVELARAGARVVLVSSGDAGVHGMAARTLARAAGLPAAERPAVEVVPGVTAALAAAARLGAPLSDDCATLSLSDLHVEWAVVERRLTALAAAGIALALYNPRSKTRTEPFDRALAILREHRSGETPVVVATDVAREGERFEHATLATLDPTTVTMRSLVLVAGETAEWAGEWLVARRETAAGNGAVRGDGAAGSGAAVRGDGAAGSGAVRGEGAA
jgi:precorrin-3B C17-methyltransferase